MYIIIEMQTNQDGTIGTIVNSYKSRENAEYKYHEVLMYAAVSILPIHSATMLDNYGRYIKSEMFIHDPNWEPPEE